MFTYKTLKDFAKDESAVGTIMALFWFIVCAGIVGLSVDTANAWRQKERLQLTADVASHAAIVEILNGGSLADARLAARNYVLANMPNAGYGRVINEDLKDIILSDYDDGAKTVSAPVTTADVNAVTVQLHRDDIVDNPVGTYLLRIIGFPSWQVKRSGTTVINIFQECPLYEGIWAHDNIKSSNDNYFGNKYCVHSQDFVDIPQRNTFESGANSTDPEEGSYLGMPSLLDCKTKCVDSANPGSEDAAHEINLLLPDFGDIVQNTRDSMLSSSDNDLKTEFWSGKELETDIAKLQPLIDIGAIPDPNDPIYDPNNPLYTEDPLYNPNSPVFDPTSPSYNSNANLKTVPVWPVTKGYVVEIDQADFEDLIEPPMGLTYHVGCTGSGGPASIVDMLPVTNTTGGVTTYGHVQDVAMITDTCRVNFTDNSDWRGSMVLTTVVPSGSSPTLSASAGASAGDPTKTCIQPDHTYLLTLYDMNVAAKFASSNTTFMTGGDFAFAAGSSSTEKIEHWGMTVYADGTVDLTAQHDFHACGYAGNKFLGIDNFRYIKQVIPMNEKDRIAEVN